MTEKQHSRHTKVIGNVTCPKCNKKGQLKKRTNGYGKSYFQVDHYKGASHNFYEKSCYIGKIAQMFF